MTENSKNIDQSRLLALEKEIRRLKNAVEELTVLNDLAITASSSMEIEEILDIIVQKSLKAVKAEQGSILLVTEQADRPFKTLIRQENISRSSLNYRVGDHITGWVLKYRKPLMIENLAEDSRFMTSAKEKEMIRSVLCVPIWFKAKLIGVLMVTNKKTEPHFTADDMRLLSIIAAQSGQLIRNSQLQEEALEKKRLEQELAVARRIQLGLLPPESPRVKGLSISSYFNSAEAVGGDYFDFFTRNQNEVGVVIADVSGHGPSAAMTMTMIKGILHTLEKTSVSPSDLLTQVNRVLGEILPRDVFVTMQFLDFKIDRGILNFSNAGHNPLVYFDAQNQEAKLVELKGFALNLTPQATYKAMDIPIHSGDVFFIYTDGVTEAVNQNMEMFEVEQLLKIVGNLARGRKKPADIIEGMYQQLIQFMQNMPQADDIAMISICVE